MNRFLFAVPLCIKAKERDACIDHRGNRLYWTKAKASFVERKNYRPSLADEARQILLYQGRCRSFYRKHL